MVLTCKNKAFSSAAGPSIETLYGNSLGSGKEASMDIWCTLGKTAGITSLFLTSLEYEKKPPKQSACIQRICHLKKPWQLGRRQWLLERSTHKARGKPKGAYSTVDS